MKKRTISFDKSPWKGFALIGLVSTVLLVACGDDGSASGSDDVVKINDKTISGVSQKGPFVKGSSVTVYELGAQSLSQTGKSYDGKIKNERGEFIVEVEKLESPYALLKADGYYRNEITGAKSNGTVTLYAMTDLTNRSEVNVNLLTHLEYERSRYLVKNEKLSVAEAKMQAEKEVLESFGIEGDFENSESLNIFGDDAGSSALLAISVLMQGNLKEADFTERLTDYAADIEEDGKWDDEKSAAKIADWAAEKSLNGGLAVIRNNIIGWELSANVPAFEKYVNNYWWKIYALETCNKDREGEVKAAENSLSGNNGVHFICTDGAWKIATDIEKDTYKWKPGKDGDVKNGDVVKTNCYVFEDSVWRKGSANDCSLDLRGCTKSRQDTIGLGKDKNWYVCDSRKWRNATNIEKDTYQVECSKDGKLFNGKVDSTAKYVCDDGEFRAIDSLEVSADSACTSYNRGVYYVLPNQYSYYKCSENGWSFTAEKLLKGTFVDERDGHEYKTIGIKSQMWMAENLNYETSGSFCYNDSVEYCTKYGRLYQWAASVGKQETECGPGNICSLPSLNIQGVCPKGWHLPTETEWRKLFAAVGGSLVPKSSRDETYGASFLTAGKALKSTSRWSYEGDGTDAFGFSVLPAGSKGWDYVGVYEAEGAQATFWSSTEIDSRQVFYVYLFCYSDDVDLQSHGKDCGFSVRCIKDDE